MLQKILSMKLLTCISILILLISSSCIQAGVLHTLFEDNTVFTHVDRNGNSLIDPGDSFAGVLTIETTTPIIPGGVSTISALTGAYDFYVLNTTPTGAPGRINIELGANPNGFLADITGSPALDAAILQAQAGVLGSEVLRFWNGPNTLDLSAVNCATTAECLTDASTGTFWAAFGDNDADFNITVLNGVEDPAVLALLSRTFPVGTVAFNLGLVDDQTGTNIVDQDCLSSLCTGGDGRIALVGSGAFQGGEGLPEEILAPGDFQFQLATRVMEPDSIALLGLGLAGIFGVISLRNRKSKK